MSRVLDAITGQPWAITQEWLNTIVGIASREISDLEAVRVKAGSPVEGARGMVRRGRAGLISVTGPIFRRANLFTRISGATSIELLARDFQQALDDPDIDAIVLDIDSPGGEVNGINEFAEMVYAARGRKPVTAYVGHMAASAAYWIAAAAETLVIDATAMVGSIGVVMALPVDRGGGELEFVSRQSRNKRPNIGSTEGRDQIQDMIDATAEVFVRAVAKYRRVSPQTVERDFGQGGMLIGEAAVKAGMADRIGNLEALIAAYDMPAAARAPWRRADAPAPAPAMLASSLGAPAAPVTQPEAPHDPSPSTPETAPMSDDPDVAPQAAPDLPPLPAPVGDDPIVAQQVAAYAAQIQAQFRAQHETVLRQAQEQALAQFERWKAEQAAQQAILTFAQHVTTATIDRPHALAYTSEQVAAILTGLSGEKRQAVQQFMTDVVEGKALIAFDALGGQGEGADDDAPDAIRARWSKAIADRTARGLSRSAAIVAVRRDDPGLYEAYNALSALSARKGGR